jgi:hypothetical protein
VTLKEDICLTHFKIPLNTAAFVGFSAMAHIATSNI